MTARPHNYSRLAFGTSGIMGAALTDSGRLQLLGAAFENGITHFDTAPLYGQGDAESLLGRFLSKHRSQVTVATKFGLFPHSYPSILGVLKPFARVVNRRIKQWSQSRRRESRSEMTVPAFREFEQFEADPGKQLELYSAERLIAQLDTSLKKMNTDYVDVLLLHDVYLAQLNDEFIETLEAIKRAGKVVEFGVATPRARARAILDVYPQLGAVIQIPSTRFTTETDQFCHRQSSVISHSVFQTDLNWVRHWLGANQEKLPNLNGASLADIAGQLLIQRALAKTPTGTLLFSSGSVEHIIRNVRAANQAVALLAVVLTEMKRSVANDHNT